MDDSNKTQTPTGQTQDQQQPPIQNQQPQAGGGGSIVKELEPVRTQQEDVNVSEVVSPSEEEPRIHEELEKMGVKSVSESPKLDDLAKNAGVSHSGESTPAVPTGYAPITMTEDVAKQTVKNAKQTDSIKWRAALIVKFFKKMHGKLLGGRN